MKKRFETRRMVTRPIEIISSLWDDPLGFETADLSPRGAYVITEFLPEMGEHLVCSFDLGDRMTFDFFGEVVRVNLMRRKSDVAFPGFGVRFMDANAMDRLRIRRALKGTPPPVPKMRKLPRKGRLIVPPPAPKISEIALAGA